MAERTRQDVQEHGSGHRTDLPVELFEATTDCVFVVGADWRFTYLNAKALAELGGKKLLGATIWQAFPDAVGSDFEEIYRRVAERRMPETFEAFYPAPLNAWYEAHAVPYGDALVVFFRNVTERRHAADALLRRHNELDTVLSRAGVGIMQCSDDHRLIVINEQFCRIVGRTKEQLDGVPMEAFTHPADIPKNAKLLRSHRKSGKPFYIKKRYVRPNGDIVWCSVDISFVKHDETSQPTTIVVAREITGEVEAEKRAEEAKALLQAVVDSAEDLIFVKDTSGRMVLANRKMSADFGVAAGQLGGDRFPEMAERFDAEDQEVIKTGQRLIIEEQVPTPEGTLTFQTIKVPWQSGGATKGVIGISRDISERVRHEQALRHSEERFRLAALATMDAIWDWDLASGEVEWSGSSVGLTGATPGNSFEWWKARVHPDDREVVVGSIKQFVESEGQRWEREYRFRRPDGRYAYVLDRGFLLRDAAGKAIRMIGAMADATKWVEAQERINSLQAELIHMSRISAMETMGSALAHEVSQPLTAAGNYLLGARRMLESGERPSLDEARRGLDQAQTEITRAGEIIRGLRRMVEHGIVDTHPVSLLETVREALRMAIPHPRPAEMVLDIDIPPAVTVVADPVQLQQVLFNLVRNSVDAVGSSERKHISVTARRQRNEILVRVADTGEGVQPQIAKRLFSAFASTKPSGLGVGLSICRTIIEAHGGKIWAEAGEEGCGAVFSFTLPAAEQDEALTPADPNRPEARDERAQRRS